MQQVWMLDLQTTERFVAAVCGCGSQVPAFTTSENAERLLSAASPLAGRHPTPYCFPSAPSETFVYVRIVSPLCRFTEVVLLLTIQLCIGFALRWFLKKWKERWAALGTVYHALMLRV